MQQYAMKIGRRAQVLGLFRSPDAARACFDAASSAGLASEPIDLLVSDTNCDHAFEAGTSFRIRSRGMENKEGVATGGRRYGGIRADGDVTLRMKSRSLIEAHQLQRLMIDHLGEEVAIF